MIRFCAALLVFSVASIASAETYYDILKSEYGSARDNIDFSDFDKAGHPDSKACVEIHPDRPNEELLVQVSRFTRYKEGQGPLLPGKVITKIIYRQYTTDPFRGGTFERVTSSDRKREVVTRLGTGDNIQWTLTARKTFDTLIFRRDQKSGDDTIRYFGYCYEKGAPEKERP